MSVINNFLVHDYLIKHKHHIFSLGIQHDRITLILFTYLFIISSHIFLIKKRILFNKFFEVVLIEFPALFRNKAKVRSTN